MRDSSGEIAIYNVLKEAGLPFEEEYVFDDLVVSSGKPLRFDFCVFNDDGSIDFLIEFQGRQHYEPVSKFGGKKGLQRQQFNDKKKRIYCLNHGYNLVIIPFWDEFLISYDYIMEAAGY